MTSKKVIILIAVVYLLFERIGSCAGQVGDFIYLDSSFQRSASSSASYKMYALNLNGHDILGKFLPARGGHLIDSDEPVIGRKIQRLTSLNHTCAASTKGDVDSSIVLLHGTYEFINDRGKIEISLKFNEGRLIQFRSFSRGKLTEFIDFSGLNYADCRYYNYYSRTFLNRWELALITVTDRGEVLILDLSEVGLTLD